MLRTDFHFELPKELIALRPAEQRSGSRLLTLDGLSGRFEDRLFRDFPLLLNVHDLLIFNDTRVIPARVFGAKDSGGQVELLLERVLNSRTALVHVRSSKGLKAGVPVRLAGGVSATLVGREGELFVLEFSCDVLEFFLAHGQVPLPPYIDRVAEDDDKERYQTVYARSLGAVAAPTAGLHFDRSVFSALHARGVQHAFVTLHVGAGTFAPMRADDIDLHEMHSEYLEVPQGTCDAIERARAAGGRVVAVGTTVVRSLEAAAEHASTSGRAQTGARIAAFKGSTRIFIKPGFVFRVVDAMLTNFHLPESTLLMLCSAFVGREQLLAAYAHAVQARYRFFSYGDAMFLTPCAAARPAS